MNHIQARGLAWIKTPVNCRQLLEFYRELEQSTEQRVEPVLCLWWWQQSEQRQ
ncbi:TPA: hypothetical protein ACS2XB_002230 [Legionella pneumophila]|nr:hypothetical protein [Legionella pneumophila]MCK1859713.1 hypothetical protein [Legionella pneumophila]HAT2105692.1 hypothetical protein [Legionella pneumophila]HDV5714176.1 hypothetical protein [Legionella pneumophila]HDV5941366.1 hypothetical protein [Legionella pneumophila]HEL9654912.1 hypothetical protein [Legionella pneumophila]